MINSFMMLSDTTAPTAPTHLYTLSISSFGFTLNWTASSDNVAVTGYNLYRGGLFYAALGNVTSTEVTGQTSGATNSWTLKAFDAAGNLSASSVARSVTQSSGLIAFLSSTGSFRQNTACGLNPTQTYYHDGTGSVPTVGDNVYSNSAGTIGLARNHYNSGPLAGTFHIKTGGTEVDSVSLCAF
jgi:hypothetical protein